MKGSSKPLLSWPAASQYGCCQGILFWTCLRVACEAYSEADPKLIVSTLLLITGILLLVTAFRQRQEPNDPDAPPPQWISTIAGLSMLKAVGEGTLCYDCRQAVGIHAVSHQRHRRGRTG